MNTISFRLLIFGFAIGLFFSPCITNAQKPKSKIIRIKVENKILSSSAISALEWKVFQLINIKRISNGLSSLVWSEQLTAIARLHSKSMAINNFFSHIGLDSNRIDGRADSYGLGKWRMIGENIAYSRGYAFVAERTTENWLRSATHRKNLLDKRWKETGVGISIRNDGTYFITQIFLRR